MYFEFKSPIVVRRLLKLCLNEEDNIFTIEEANEFNKFIEQLASEYANINWQIQRNKEKAEEEELKKNLDEITF